MKKAFAALLLVAGILCTNSAWADYSALGDGSDIAIGAGGIYLRGDDATGASQSEFLPTVNISGLADSWAWQAFYAFGDPATAFGGTVDYIVATNWGECAECPDDCGTWWFGVGPTVISYTDLFSDAAGANGMDCTCYGANLGFGWMCDSWNFQLYAHYLVNEEVMGVQASVNYNF
jgi:hypothetical protein